jgi:hypothetical protein
LLTMLTPARYLLLLLPVLLATSCLASPLGVDGDEIKERRFLSAPKFAVVGASDNDEKYGTIVGLSVEPGKSVFLTVFPSGLQDTSQSWLRRRTCQPGKCVPLSEWHNPGR